MDLQDGRGHEALQRLTTHFAARPGGQRLDLGLLLADLHGQLGMFDAAAGMCRQLAKESGEDVRAVIALALIYQDQGDAAEVEHWLEQTSLLRENEGRPDPLVDHLAYLCGLQAARLRAEQPRPEIPAATPLGPRQ